MWLPTLCRKLQVPYCIVKSRSRIGTLVYRKTCSAVAILDVNKEVSVSIILGRINFFTRTRMNYLHSQLYSLNHTTRTQKSEECGEVENWDQKHWLPLQRDKELLPRNKLPRPNLNNWMRLLFFPVSKIQNIYKDRVKFIVAQFNVVRDQSSFHIFYKFESRLMSFCEHKGLYRECDDVEFNNWSCRGYFRVDEIISRLHC